MPAALHTRACAVALALVGAAVVSPASSAQTVTLESATLGATGKIGGASVTARQFIGWRFAIDYPLVIDQIGGHMLSQAQPGDVFAALITLPTLGAFPAGAPFTEEEVLATTLFQAPFPSAEFRTPLHAAIEPGAYALVFGSGVFGATGEGAFPNLFDQEDIPPTDISSFIFFGPPGPGEASVWRTNLSSHMRIVIEGHAPLAADFNIDGAVDAVDLALWQAGFGLDAAATRLDGDANADGAVDGSDLLVWQQQVDASVASAPGLPTAAAQPLLVPEPSAQAAAVSALVAVIARYCRRGRQPRERGG